MSTTESTPLFHVLESQQFSRDLLEKELFPETQQMRARLVRGERAFLARKLRHKMIAVLFYAPSTRTRVSFELAAQYLGANIVSSENAGEFSSASKGETIEDTTVVINNYHCDGIVYRTKEEGEVARAANVSRVPVFNAGDGSGQHPTQALLDLFTIYEKYELIDGLNISLVGDLSRGRTIRSLAYLLGKYRNIHLNLVSPPSMKMRQDLIDYLQKHDVSYCETNDLATVAHTTNVVYLTRAQVERRTDNDDELSEGVDGQGVRLNDRVMTLLDQAAIIMHPLPRSDDFGELTDPYLSDPRVVAFSTQVGNGLYTRMALLDRILGK